MLASALRALIAVVVALLPIAPMAGQGTTSAEAESSALARLRETAANVPADPGWRVRRIQNPNPLESQDRIDVYQVEEVQTDLTAVRSDLIAAAGDHSVLQAYLANRLSSGAGLSGAGGVIRASEADSFWAGLVAVVRAIERLDDLKVDLEVVTLPRNGAAVRLSAVGVDDEIRETSTRGTLSGVWRGLYRYEVKLGNAVRWEGRLDLVQERGNRLVCVEPDDPVATPVPCRLEAP